MEFPKVYAFDKNSKEDTIHIEVYVDAMDAIKIMPNPMRI